MLGQLPLLWGCRGVDSVDDRVEVEYDGWGGLQGLMGC